MSKRFYPPSQTEIDMRQEMTNTLDGKYPEVKKKHTAILRKLRRPLVQCSCVDPNTHEPDKDTFCAFCWGEGYIWDEIYIDVYKVVIKSDVGNADKEVLHSPGLINEPLVIFYTRSSVDITEKDKIIELILDSEGELAQPLQRKKLYRIGTAIDLRLDHGKLEYWKLDCYSEYRKFLNGPGSS